MNRGILFPVLFSDVGLHEPQETFPVSSSESFVHATAFGGHLSTSHDSSFPLGLLKSLSVIFSSTVMVIGINNKGLGLMDEITAYRAKV